MNTFRNFCVIETDLRISPLSNDGPLGVAYDLFCTLAVKAVELFTGYYRELPSGRTLPWFAEYHTCKGDESALGGQIPIKLNPQEIHDIASDLGKAGQGMKVYQGRTWASLFFRDRSMNQRARVQYAAVEALMHGDSFLSCLHHKRHSDAMVWLAGGYEAYCYATLCAQSARGCRAQSAGAARGPIVRTGLHGGRRCGRPRPRLPRR